METRGFRKRSSQIVSSSTPDLGAKTAGTAQGQHPAGPVKHGGLVQLIRMLLFATWSNCCAVCIHVTQILGSPLYFFNKDYYYAYMALTKRSFGLLITTMTQWFSPTLIRVSGDASMRGQLKQTSDGRLETTFPERLVLMANHQLYTDWLYLWWIAYTGRMHGHIYIILKEALKYVPVIGPGMMFFGFIFMSRKWEADKPRLQHRLEKLKAHHAGPLSGSKQLDPMWLLIFPEGTNLSANTRKGSKAWAEKQDVPDMQHLLLPRSTGLHFCLQQLRGTVDWVYDCTVAYEGIPKGGYAQDYFTLRSTFFQGRPPKSVNMYWRRYHISDIPLDDSKEFGDWLKQRWEEKDQFLEGFSRTGRFPADDAATGEKTQDYIDTQVRLMKWYEIGQIFVVLAALALLVNVVTRLFQIILLPAV